MEEGILIQISQRIRERRKELGITIQDLADKIQMSKALVSQVENGRTIPSLVVLINIIKALKFDLDEFFRNLDPDRQRAPIIVKRKAEYEYFEKEHANGFHYFRIFSKTFSQSTIDMVILELEPGANRPMVETAAYEYKYILQGNIDYHFDNEIVSLCAGDSLLFDGRIPHTPRNTGTDRACMMVIYFFEQQEL